MLVGKGTESCASRPTGDVIPLLLTDCERLGSIESALPGILIFFILGLWVYGE